MMHFGTLMLGAKSIAHWGYWAEPAPGFYSVKEPMIRLGLGGAAGNRIGPYVLPDRVAAMLKDTWDEIGRVNAELRTIGPLVARSDVSLIARLTRVEPATDRNGNPAVEASALVSGLDTVIVLVLNRNIDTTEAAPPHRSTLRNPNPPTYPPAKVSVEVKVPDWLDPQHVFSVDHEAIEELSPARAGNTLRLAVPRLEVSNIFVITSSDVVRESCLARHAEMRKLLAKMATHEPVPNPDWQE